MCHADSVCCSLQYPYQFTFNERNKGIQIDDIRKSTLQKYPDFLNTVACLCIILQPERIDPPDPTKPDYDIRADVWSLGISLVKMDFYLMP